jgi:hypothetical protein
MRPRALGRDAFVLRAHATLRASHTQRVTSPAVVARPVFGPTRARAAALPARLRPCVLARAILVMKGAAPPSGFSLNYQPALDGLRAVSIVAVLAHHSHWLTGGYLGVDIFFTLSGFLITALLTEEFARTGTIRLRLFHARRPLCLLPALLVLLIVCAGSLLATVPAEYGLLAFSTWPNSYIHHHVSSVAEVVSLIIAHVVSAPDSALTRPLAIAPLVRFGRISYGVYLWHFPVFCLWRARDGSGPPPRRHGSRPPRHGRSASARRGLIRDRRTPSARHEGHAAPLWNVPISPRGLVPSIAADPVAAEAGYLDERRPGDDRGSTSAERERGAT